MGFEAAEPTGLFQYSFSEGIPYPGYHNGIGVDVKPAKQVGIYVALLSGVWNVNDTDVKNPGIEAQVALTPMEQLTAKVGYAHRQNGGLFTKANSTHGCNSRRDR